MDRNERDLVHVRSWRDAPEFVAHGVQVRAIYFPDDLPVPSPFQPVAFAGPIAYVLYNTLRVGETNEAHVHDDEEKVHFVVRGNGRISCGDTRAEVAAGDYFFFPARIQHSIQSLGPEDLEYVVCAVKTPSGKEALRDAGGDA